jgi:peptidylprolyl isomerase
MNKRLINIIKILFSVALPAIVLVTGCSSAPAVKNGDTIKVSYTGKLANGTVFDSSAGRAPLEFKVGSGQVIQGFDKAVIGMKVGDSKTFTIPAAEAYGPVRNELITTIDRSQLPSNIAPQIGQKLQMQTSNGAVTVKITAISGNTITLDANHDLAGKDLTFEIKLVEIKQ